MSCFDQIKLLPEDPIMHLPILFAADKNPNKVNLGIGSYKNESSQPVVFSSVQKAEKLLAEKKLNKEYPPIEGNAQFNQSSLKLIFGDTLPQLSENLFAEQTVGGTSALRVAGEFLARNCSKEIFIPDPTWANHKLIFPYANMQINNYPYYDSKSHGIDFSAMLKAIGQMEKNSVILLHGSCHNPTGVDPTQEQWRELSNQIKKHRIIPLFDLAYQGFGEGLEEDAFAVRLFAKEGHEMFVASSNAKNFGLYGERVGMLTAISHHSDAMKKIRSHLKQTARSCYSVPPIHGARIVETILASTELTNEWKQELDDIRRRIKNTRDSLVSGLKRLNSNRDFSFLTKQLGLFSYTGLTAGQVDFLRHRHGIYLAENGRINIAGLNPNNIEYVVHAVIEALSV